VMHRVSRRREEVQVELPDHLRGPVGHPPDALPELLERRIDAERKLQRLPVRCDRKTQGSLQHPGKRGQLLLADAPLQLIDHHDLPVRAEGPWIKDVHVSPLLSIPANVTSNRSSIRPSGNPAPAYHTTPTPGTR